jgi:hypothetical protein
MQFLKAFKPDGDALLRRISTHIDDAKLELIANADPVGGVSRRARFMNSLRDIRDGGGLKKQSDFASWEQFRDQDVTEILNFSSYGGGHLNWPGAFACAVLVRSYADPEVRASCAGNYNDAIVRLIESVRHLDAGFEPDTMSALAWFITRAEDVDYDQRAFAGIGILLLAVNSKNMVSHDTIMKLTDWLVAEEKRAFDAWGESVGNFPTHWLFRTTYFDMERGKWMAIGSELAASQISGPCGDAVRSVGQRLSGKTLMS